ncbi:4a-hydroxytetrahydrobiopterin dehydratase [Patescibacteria group bacterium]|nr:4a-hydroxytetrahydrobiopterin dehydratase [Patescibacteria group bacterium]
MLHQNTSPNHLTQGNCVPCEGGVEPMTRQEMEPYLQSVKDWQLVEVDGIATLKRDLTLPNFVSVIDLVNKIAKLSESEGHHPNLFIHDYKHLRIDLYTHAIGGLSVNDFILAAKIDELV